MIHEGAPFNSEPMPNETRFEHGQPWAELERAACRLFYGRDTRPGLNEGGESTMFRAVVTAGSVIAEVGGSRLDLAFGAAELDARRPEASRALVAKLREIASDIERKLDEDGA